MEKQHMESQPDNDLYEDIPNEGVNLLRDAAREKAELARSTGKTLPEQEAFLRQEELDARTDLQQRDLSKFF